MCGDFESWHGGCYAGLSQQETDARHKRFTLEWKREARRQTLAKAMSLNTPASRDQP